MSTLYQQIDELSRPLMTQYVTDLELDRQVIEANPGMPFLHVTRPAGTEMILFEPADHECWPADGEQVPYMFGTANREHILAGKLSLLGAAIQWNNYCLILHYDGSRLREVDHEQAVKALATYSAQTLRAWGQEPVTV